MPQRNNRAIREAIERSEKRLANAPALEAAQVIREDRDQRDLRDCNDRDG